MVLVVGMDGIVDGHEADQWIPRWLFQAVIGACLITFAALIIQPRSMLIRSLAGALIAGVAGLRITDLADLSPFAVPLWQWVFWGLFSTWALLVSGVLWEMDRVKRLRASS